VKLEQARSLIPGWSDRRGQLGEGSQDPQQCQLLQLQLGRREEDTSLAVARRLDVCLHIKPIPTEITARRLRQQQLARLESARYLGADKGRLTRLTSGQCLTTRTTGLVEFATGQ
jgi:hypothetical protein